MSDPGWMERALALGRSAMGTTAPNPPVGAVLVRGGAVIGEGRTQPVGGHHAEVMALNDAVSRGEDPRGATMYVTLEPCCHHGRTPPCTDALIRAGVARVVVGVVDPYPVMRGNGLRILEDAGIAVSLGVLQEACSELILGFARALLHDLPEVSSKVACTLDGRIATASGESQWITGPAARAVGQELRAQHDAICVGIGTLLADNPRLTCRSGGADPVPVVFDSQLRTPADARIFASSRRPILFCLESAPERELAADIVRLPEQDARVDVRAAMAHLVSRGLHRVLVEGGGELHRSLLEARLVDHLHVFLAPVGLPGGRPWLGGSPVRALGDAIDLGRLVNTRRVGRDVLLNYRLEHAVGGSQ